MNKYVAVYFGPKEADNWVTFLKAMNGLQIISMSMEQIDEDYKIFVEQRVGTMNRIVLHDDKEVTDFECVMKIFFPNKEYKITDDPDDEEFSKWLQEKSSGITFD